jgi:short-subunit dehydrogenase
VSGRPGPALVTGATAGIGREFCEQLAGRGHDLLVVARDRTRLETTAAELAARHRISAEPLVADLAREDEVLRVADWARSAGLALLINNAGFGTTERLAHADPERQADMIRLHALAPVRLALAALPGMLERRAGAIVNVSSVAGFAYSPGSVTYCATKAFLTVWSEGLAAELRGTGVRVQALCPGLTRTEFHQRMQDRSRRAPALTWLSAGEVVRASLRALDRGRPTVCIPSARYRLLTGLVRITPRPLLGRLAALRRRLDVT